MSLSALSRAEMALYLCMLFFFFLISSANACCITQSKAKYFRTSTGLSAGACGYGSQVTSWYGTHLAAATRSIYRLGADCGSCFQIRCKDKKLCTEQGTRVIVTDINQDNTTDFVLSSIAFRSMAKKGMDQVLLNLGIADVEYKKVHCNFENKNFSIRVEESSKKPNYLAAKFLFQGGKTEILLPEVSTVGSTNWTGLNRNHGAIWDTSDVPKGGPLQFRWTLDNGFDSQWIYLVTAKKVIPADWKVGVIYDTGIKINETAADGCSPCDDGWPKK